MAYAARVRRLRLAAPVHPQPAFGPDEIAKYRDVLAAYEALAAQLAEQRRNSDLADDKQLAAENRDMRALLAFPGVRTALLHALHSDHHAHAATRERSARDEAVGRLTAIYKRIGVDR